MKRFPLAGGEHLAGLLLAACLALPARPVMAADAAPAQSAGATPVQSVSPGTPPAAGTPVSSAAPAGNAAAPSTGSLLPGEAGGGLLRSLMGLAIVLSLIGGLAWLGRKFGNRVTGGKSNVLKTVAALAVGQRENVVVVELGEQWLVLGVAPGRVNTLAQLPRQELPQAEMQAGAKTFARLLARAQREERK